MKAALNMERNGEHFLKDEQKQLVMLVLKPEKAEDNKKFFF